MEMTFFPRTPSGLAQFFIYSIVTIHNSVLVHFFPTNLDCKRLAKKENSTHFSKNAIVRIQYGGVHTARRLLMLEKTSRIATEWAEVNIRWHSQPVLH